MVKFFIDPGHGGTDPGATGNGLQEKNLTLQISKKIRDMLGEYENTQVRLSREGNQTLTLNQRTNAANAWGADFLLSVHINAGGGTGYEDFRYNTLSASSTTGRIQSAIHSAVMVAIRGFGVSDRGAKSANFHMLRESNMPAVLTENLFIDTPQDANLLKRADFIEAMARGHVNGLANAFGLKRKVTTKPVTPPKPPVTQPKPSVPTNPKEDDDMLERAVVINGFADFPAAERLALYLKAPIYLRSIVTGQKVAKELYIVGGTKEGMVANKVTLLSGADRFETAAAVANFIK
ncbi:N-acetylmuramoyl-L-alanine amidase family protein [Cytobacillus oceanisediminis]|uniref:N-acetylmuramoyl-L-alanine amidase family protein n=1 Tax=Cytobacillus TaxID=2675230 RepID=UPI002559AD9D|nr:N-acetylmuramoyl-L-alanine amidase [Cytobacillus oceanisediminis]